MGHREKQSNQGASAGGSNVTNYYFKCMYSNVDSLLNKRDLLKLRIKLEKPDIILISEVLPKRCITAIQESDLQLDGYDLHSNLSMESCKEVC